MRPSTAAAGGSAHLQRKPQLWRRAPNAEVLGEGSFGRVYRGSYRNIPAAIKEVTAEQSRSVKEALKRELACSQQLLLLNHPNVVRFFEFDDSKVDCLVVVMELLCGMDLHQLRRGCQQFDHALMRAIMRQTCCGLNHLHTQNPSIIHRDLKGTNIMVLHLDKHMHQLQVKLIDLGLAALCSHNSGCTKDSPCLGASRYRAPEIWADGEFSCKSDVFALGCTLYEMMVGRPPNYDVSNDPAVCLAVMRNDIPVLPECAADDVIEFYSGCVQWLPNLRPTVAELMRFAFLSDSLAS